MPAAAAPLILYPVTAFTVPVKLAALEMVWELMRPEVIVPAVRAPMLPEVEKRFVEDAVVENSDVVVADVVVERVMLSKILAPVKVCVEERSARVMVPEGIVAIVVAVEVRVSECAPTRMSEEDVGMVRVPALPEMVRPLIVPVSIFPEPSRRTALLAVLVVVASAIT